MLASFRGLALECGLRVQDFGGLGYRRYWFGFRVSGFRGLGFQGLGFRV